MAKNLFLGPSENFFTNNVVVFVHHIAWTPPSGGSWKLHFSGYATTDSCDGGAGFILRDQNAMFISAGSEPVEDMCSIREAELRALRLGLSDAMLKGVDYLEVEGDSATVIAMLNGNLPPPSSSLEEILNDCVQYLDVFRNVKISRVHSQANLAARVFAAEAANLTEVYIWCEEPSQVTKVLIDDVCGRLVPHQDLL